MSGATALIGDGSDVDGSIMSVIVIASWRARKSNLIHQRCPRWDIDVWQGDAISISDREQIKRLVAVDR
jgi:hypothetical protein